MLSAIRLFRRFSAVGCAIVVFLLTIPMVGAEEEAGAASGTSGTQYGKEGSYILYRQQHMDAARPSTDIQISATEEYSASADSNVRTETLEGRDALIWDSESGQVEWRFFVEEEGLYQFSCDYYALPGKGGSLEFGLMLDGEYPFEEVEKITLPRLWRDVYSPVLKDNGGNDIRSPLEEIQQWQTGSLVDTEGFVNGPFSFYLTSGEHTLSLVASKEPAAFSSFRFYNTESVPTYDEYRAAQPDAPVIEGEVLHFEAERTASKTSSMLYPFADRSDPYTSPSDPVKKYLNVS